MRTLTVDEIPRVSGGWWQGVAGGVIGNLIYEGIGGIQGISSMLETTNDYLSDKVASMGDEILANPDGHGYID
tara:strand:- start:123 stop:341 length:219 start_codon:yes stop_codon:yes gene_type:complete